MLRILAKDSADFGWAKKDPFFNIIMLRINPVRALAMFWASVFGDTPPKSLPLVIDLMNNLWVQVFLESKCLWPGLIGSPWLVKSSEKADGMFKILEEKGSKNK